CVIVWGRQLVLGYRAARQLVSLVGAMKLARALVPVAASLVIKLDAVVLEGKNKQSLPDPNEVSLPSVPNVVDAGKTGFPELPAVTTMLSDAAQTLTGISTQAQRLQTQMMQVQQENAARMQRQKAVFDRKLKEQEQKNLEVVKENALIAKNIMDTKKVNEDLLHHAQSMQKGNALRHSELKMLQDQLAAAQKFLTESVEQTDDTKATDLDVLAEEDASPKGLSLLALSSTSNTEPAEKSPEAKASDNSEPESLITMLASGIKALKKQGQVVWRLLARHDASRGDSCDPVHFLASRKTAKPCASSEALHTGSEIKEATVLKETLETMKTYHNRLDAADKHLQATQTTMDGRLHDGGMFMQKLSELTMARPEAAVHALSNLEQAKK
ncbi:unnamed protein product, partial [Symbiodinium sp. CCMP2456]